jgi:putative ABC transport system ATP-binding protein
MAIHLRQVAKSYHTGAGRFEALKALSLNMSGGELIGLVGPSGSGKSTLINLITGIDHPSSGSINVDGEDLGGLSEARLAGYRGANIGIVFQSFQLMPTLTARENIVLAMDLVRKIPTAMRRQRASDLMRKMGVERHGDKMPAKLSGGEQQRVAVARALANDPAILVADEPTGSLDRENSDRLMDLFEDCAAEGRLVIIATHDSGQMHRFGRVLNLIDGALVGDEVRTRG